MKEIVILRHGDWDLTNDKLTDDGSKKTSSMKSAFDNLFLVYSSPFGRAKETAKLLSGKTPIIDHRAGVLKTTKEQAQKVNELRKTHPLGVAGAIFSLPELRESVKDAGNQLIELIKEILNKLSAGQQALIVSHDGTMVSAEKLLRNEPFNNLEKTYSSLQGYTIDENLNIHEFKTK